MPGEYRKRELIDNTFVVTHTVDDAHDGWRADCFLKENYTNLSRNHLQNLIKNGRVLVTATIPCGKPTKRLKASTLLRAGDQIQVFTEYQGEPAVDLNYKTLYEDDFVLVVDKPGNLPVHPAGKFLFHTLLMHLRQSRTDWRGHDKNFYLVHRLDRETSGVLLLAKRQSIVNDLVRQFAERKTEKRYLAVVEGSCEQDLFSVDADLGSAKSSAVRLKMAAYPKGQGELESLTEFEVLYRGKGSGKSRTLVLCKPKTGRQHQIRVHLAAAGYPICGDKLYGTDETEFLKYLARRDEDLVSVQRNPGLLPKNLMRSKTRHALHSAYLKFFHVAKKEWIEIESPLPEDMATLMDDFPKDVLQTPQTQDRQAFL